MPARSKVRRWGRRCTTAILVVIGLALVVMAVYTQVDYAKFEPVLSGSMRPGIQPGDLIVVTPMADKSLKVGDVIMYLPPAHTLPVIHRIVSITPKGILTKGDANNDTDPWGRVQLKGTTIEHLVAVVPLLGWLAHWRDFIWMAMGIIVFLLLLFNLRSTVTPAPKPVAELTRKAT